MSRLSLFNILFGFTIILFASCWGAFLSREASYALVENKELLNRWFFVIQKSAHSHSNQFAQIQILFGLTLSFSQIDPKYKLLQTIALVLGTFSMSILMFFKSLQAPSHSIDSLQIIMAMTLGLWLLGIASHCFGLAQKLFKRGF